MICIRTNIKAIIYTLTQSLLKVSINSIHHDLKHEMTYKMITGFLYTHPYVII